MITVISGLTGSGKTWFMVNKLIMPDWLQGYRVWANFPLLFPNDNANITRWSQLDELHYLNNGIIAIDEGQKLFDAHRWQSLPISFAEKIAQHRKHFLDIYTTTQDFGHIDQRVRTNVHEWYHCQSIFRFPKNDRKYPILQITKVIKKERKMTADSERITWETVGTKKYYISRYWTKELYSTFADIGFERYICKLKLKGKKWVMKIYSRDIINSGKKRL